MLNAYFLDLQMTWQMTWLNSHTATNKRKTNQFFYWRIPSFHMGQKHGKKHIPEIYT